MSDIDKHDSVSSCFDKHFYQSEVYLAICGVNYTVVSQVSVSTDKKNPIYVWLWLSLCQNYKIR